MKSQWCIAIFLKFTIFFQIHKKYNIFVIIIYKYNIQITEPQANTSDSFIFIFLSFPYCWTTLLGRIELGMEIGRGSCCVHLKVIKDVYPKKKKKRLKMGKNQLLLAPIRFLPILILVMVGSSKPLPKQFSFLIPCIFAVFHWTLSACLPSICLSLCFLVFIYF